MNFIILADKFQKRMKSKGCVSLLKVNNKTTLLQHQYSVIKHNFPNAKIRYVYGFDHKKLEVYLAKNSYLQKDITSIYNPLYAQYNHTYSLYLCCKYLTSDCFLLFGDTILNTKLFNNFKPSNSSKVFISPKNKSNLGCVIHNNQIHNICYDLDNHILNMYYISKEHIQTLKQVVEDKLSHNHFIFETINKLIDRRCIIEPVYHNSHIKKKLLRINHVKKQCNNISVRKNTKY
jgi:CTP:phosphocholine cytidylyltransferase-like protein